MVDQIIAYCVKEKANKLMKDAQQVTLKNGRVAMQGICSSCGTKMMKFISIKNTIPLAPTELPKPDSKISANRIESQSEINAIVKPQEQIQHTEDHNSSSNTRSFFAFMLGIGVAVVLLLIFGATPISAPICFIIGGAIYTILSRSDAPFG